MIAGSFRLAGMCSIVGSCMSCCYQWKRRAAVAVLSICIDAVRMRLLWLSIICFVLFMQL